jgi:hypothetical protein
MWVFRILNYIFHMELIIDTPFCWGYSRHGTFLERTSLSNQPASPRVQETSSPRMISSSWAQVLEFSRLVWIITSNRTFMRCRWHLLHRGFEPLSPTIYPPHLSSGSTISIPREAGRIITSGSLSTPSGLGRQRASSISSNKHLAYLLP